MSLPDTDPGLQQLRGAQAAERHDYLGPARERGRAELSIPLPIVVVVRGVVAALEPGYSSFVIAGENSAVIEAGAASAAAPTLCRPVSSG